MNNRILITGNGSLATELHSILTNMTFAVTLLPKDVMDITNARQVDKIISRYGDAKYIIHTAAICKPMSNAELFPVTTTETNVVGTFNVMKSCIKYDKKMIYISTDFVYPEGKWKAKTEKSPVFPLNRYAWGKLGGECVIRAMADESKYLILRCAITEIPFRHNRAFSDIKKNSITHFMVASIIPYLLKESGTINVGGKFKSIYDFVSQHHPIEDSNGGAAVSNSVKMSTKKLKSILKEIGFEYITRNI